MTIPIDDTGGPIIIGTDFGRDDTTMVMLARMNDTVTEMCALPPALLGNLDRPPSTAAEIQLRISKSLLHFDGRLNGINWLNRTPARIHRRRRWMSDAYHHRIQKKWNKRFGIGFVAFLEDQLYNFSRNLG